MDYEMDYSENQNFEPHGYYTVSNSHGYEIMLSDDGDMAKVKDGDMISDWLEIEYIDEESVIDPEGYHIPMNLVMRKSYPKQSSVDKLNESIDRIKKSINY
jgi:hypothetical protein